MSVPALKMEAKANIKNRFDIKVEDIKTGKVQWLKAENIVLDACFTRLVNFQTYFTNIHFGTGTGTLSAARTALFTFLSQKAASTVQTVRAHPTSRWVRNIVINPEEHVGAVLTEVGIAYGTASSNLCTHAFIEDAEGNPISLLKTDTMVVIIYATVYFELGAIDVMYGGKWRFVQPLANNELLSYLMGTTYPTQQFRVTRAPEFSNGTAPGSHGSSPNILVADWIRDAANKKVTTPVRRLGIATGNGEVRGLGLGSSDTLGTFRGQFPIAGVFTSKAIAGEVLGTGNGVLTGFNPTWSYADISAIKVDDVAVNPANYDLAATKKGTNVFLGKAVASLAGTDSNPQHLTDGSPSTGTSVGWGAPQYGIDFGVDPPRVDKFRFRRQGSADSRILYLYGTNESDYSSGVLLAQHGTNATGEYTVNFASPVNYRCYYIQANNTITVNQIELLTADDQITFHTPPANGAVITADYTVDYVPKDSNHVLDLQCAIQYGEIV